MRMSISGRHLEITEALKTHVEERLNKLLEHFDKVIDANVVLSVEKHRHLAEITLHANGLRIHSKASTGDMYSSIDEVVEKLDKRVLKHKTRINGTQQRNRKPLHEYDHHIFELEEEHVEAAVGVEEPPHRIIEKETLQMTPMTVTEATLQLDLAHEDFLVFSNAETQKLNVVYDRGDGKYGLIEPQY